MPDLSVGAPMAVAGPGIAQVGPRDFLQPARRVKLRREFVGDRLIVNEAVRVGRADRRFVEVFRIEHPALNPRDLRAHQGGSVFKIGGAMLGPYLELLIVFDQGIQMPLLLFGRSRIPRGRVSQGSIESEVACLDL